MDSMELPKTHWNWAIPPPLWPGPSGLCSGHRLDQNHSFPGGWHCQLVISSSSIPLSTIKPSMRAKVAKSYTDEEDFANLVHPLYAPLVHSLHIFTTNPNTHRKEMPIHFQYCWRFQRFLKQYWPYICVQDITVLQKRTGFSHIKNLQNGRDFIHEFSSAILLYSLPLFSLAPSSFYNSISFT